MEQFFSQRPGRCAAFFYIYIVEVCFEFEAHAQDAALYGGVEFLVFASDDEDVVNGAKGKIGGDDQYGAFSLSDDSGGFGTYDFLEGAVGVLFTHSDEAATVFFAGFDDLFPGIALAQHEAEAFGYAVVRGNLSKFGEAVPGSAFLAAGYPAGSAEERLRFVNVEDTEVHVVGAGKLIGISQCMLRFRREVCRKDDSVWVHSWDGFVLKRTFAGA